MGQVGRGPRGRHAHTAASRLPAALLAVAGLVVVALAAILATRLLGSGSGNSKASAGDDRSAHVAVTTSPATRPSPSVSARRVAHRDPLGTAAQSYLATRSGTVLAAVYDLGTNQLWTLGHGTPQAEASIVKLDILETLLAQHHADGTALSPQEASLTQTMIEDSDNDSATSLWDAVGGARGIRSYNTAVGLTSTTPSKCVDCPGFPWPGWGLTTTTPADQISLLLELVRPNAQLTSAQRDYALGLMENVTESQRWGVSGGVPASARVALKNGWLPLAGTNQDWQINSIGWISGNGRSYLAAVLSTGNPTEQYGIDTINSLAELVWDRMR